MSEYKYPTSLQKNVNEIDAIDQSVFAGKDVRIVSGLTRNLAEQLVEASQQPHMWTCPDDAGKRFGSLENVEKWQKKGRLSLPLVRDMGDGALQLMGFGWMGPAVPGKNEPEIPGAKTTFAIRLYEGALGQGLATPYTQTILDAHQAETGDNDGVWLSAWSTNSRAVGSYEKVGFKTVAEIPGVLNGEKLTRVYMTLGDYATNSGSEI